MVNQDGISLYIWRQRHAVKWRVGSVSSSSETESEEDEWYETSDEDGAPVNFPSRGGRISDDSDDEPYEYAHQRDLRPLNSDSEGDE